MTERTEPFPTHLWRWLMAPAAFGTLFAALTALLRRTREPSLPRMSDEWLNSYHQDSSHHRDYE